MENLSEEEREELNLVFRRSKNFLKVLFVLLIILIICSLSSCSGTKNICKTSFRVNGEVLYSKPRPHATRDVIMINYENDEEIIIYRVPLQQPLYDIPVCQKKNARKNKYWWVMP